MPIILAIWETEAGVSAPTKLQQPYVKKKRKGTGAQLKLQSSCLAFVRL
jgi:hypothetical protein